MADWIKKAPDLPYSLTILSPIPVCSRDGTLVTLDLWARDLFVQRTHVSSLRVICPVINEAVWNELLPVPEGVEILRLDTCKHVLLSAIKDSDILQLPGSSSWSNSSLSRFLMKEARRSGTKSIVGISSNRAGTALLNSRSGNALRRIQGLIQHASIRLNLRFMTARADGTFIVGAGLLPLVSAKCRSVHVGTASWIMQSDLKGPDRWPPASGRTSMQRFLIASRLEPMKGVHLGIEAFSKGAKSIPGAQLSILGSGPERLKLEQQVAANKLQEAVCFEGTLRYPQPFLQFVQHHDAVILTNLGDEQPRIVFDAISQGAIPICPDAPAYTSLGIPRQLLYQKGNAQSLAEALINISRLSDNSWIRQELLRIAANHTLESMHAKRAEWIENQVLARSG